MKRKVFLINLLILGVLFGFSQKARGDTIPTVFNVAVTQTGATAPLVREGSFDVEIIFTVDATNNLDLSVVPTVTFTPQVGGPFNITPLDPTNPLNFGPHPTPPADPAHNYYIFRGTGHALSTMGTGWANMTISGAQSDSGTMTSHTKTNAFYIDYTAPAVTPNCPAGITVAPPVTGVGTVVITVAFAENYLLDYSVLPTVAVSDASGAPVVVANPSYGGNTWTGTATIAGTVASGNATIVVTGATDLAGNVMLTCDQKTFLVDNTPPESSAQPLPACSNGVPILIFYQAQDVGSDSSGVASVQLWYRLNGGAWVNSGIASSGVVFAFSPALDGNYEFATVATDNVGNQEATPTITTTADASTILDQSAPTVASVTTIPDPAGEGNVTITITFADDGCGLDYDTIPTVSISPAVTVTRLTYENNTWTGQASIISTTTEGQATITIGGATDCCGNVMASNNNYSFCIDRTAPRIANTTDVQINPQNRGAGECSNIGEVTFTITFTENGCAGLDPDVDLDVFFNPAGTDEEIPVEGSYSSGNTWGGTAIVTEDMANGDATVIIRGATDRAGNAMAPYNQASFCIDTTAPSSQAEALNACFKGNPLRIYYQVNDLTSAIDFVELWYRQAGSLDWMFSGKSDATPLTGYFDLVVGSFPDGTYEFHTIAVDEVGNREAPPATADATTTLDRSRPTVASVTTTPDPAGEGNVTITITFNDEGCGLDYDTIPQVSYQIGVGPSVTVTQLTYEDNTWTGQALITGTAPTTEGQAVITIAGATDCCGNVMANNSAYGFCIDRTAPTIANTTDVQINPQNRGVGECSNIGEVTFTITFTENGCAGLDPDVDLDVLFNPAGTDEEIPVEGSYGSGNTWAGTAIVTEDMANGDATVIIRGATDRAGNAMAPYNQASFCIDTTAPQSWVEALSTHSNQSSITVKYQDNDPGVGNSGVNTVQLWYRLNGGTWIKSNAQQDATNKTFTFIPGVVDGTYGFATQATDRAGNREALPTTADASITIDRDLPIVISATASPNPAREGKVVITLTFSDADGINHDTSPLVQFTPNGTTDKVPVEQVSWANNTWTGQATILSNYPNGQAKIDVSRVTDNAGNRMADAQPASFVIDTIPPKIEVCSTTEAGHGITVKPDPAPAGEILFKIEFAENYQLNYNISPTVVFYPKDQTTPVAVTKSSYGSNLWTGIALIPAGTPNGKATIVVTGATDLAGNVMPACKTSSFIIDTTPPQSWVEALPQYSTGNSIQITYSADDPGVSPSGVNEVELWYRVNGGSWINSGQTSTTATGSFAFNFLDWVDGLYEFATMATDAAANQESLPVTADASTTVNRQGPSVILATANPSPAGEGYVTITVTFDDGGNGLDYNIVPTVTYVIGTTTVNVSQSSYANNTWTGQALISSGMNGQATIRVRNFADLVGNLVSSDVSAGIFTIDTTPPVTNCSTNAPNPGITVTYAPAPVGEVTFEIRFTESSLNYSVSPTVIFYPKDSIIPIQVAEASYINNLWTGTALIPAGTPDGYATIVITGAADLAGNVMPACNAAKFIIDTVAPVSQATAASESGSSLRIDYTAQDLPTQESSGLDQVYLYYRVDVGDGFSEWKWTGLNNPGTTGTGHFIFSPINGDGVYEFYTLAIDKVKNVEVAPTVADVSYNYDKQGPRVRNVTVTPDPAGEGVVTFEIEFGEEANGLNYDVPVTVKFKPYGSNIYPQATQVSYENSIWTGTANILQSYTSGEAKIEISGAEDTLNNPMRQNSAYNFIIDTTAPKIDKLTDIQIIPQDGVDQKCSRVGEVTFVVAITENYLLDYEAPVAVTFYPANTPDPVEVIEYSYRNNVWTGKAVVTSDMENGEATVNITGITDLAGNVVQAHNKAHFCIDVVPPESAAIAAYPGNSIHIDYTARDLPTEEASDLKRVDLYYRVDVGDGFPEEYSWTGLDPKTASKGTFIFNPKNGDGVYEFYTLATDEAHNVEEAPDLADVSFIYDNKKPTVKSVTVTPDPTGAGEGEITFEIEFGNETNGLDYDIPVKVEFQPNGDLSNWYEVYQVAWGEEENIWTGKANILQSYNSGQAKIRINKAKDTLGNEMTENSSFRFTIDTDPPEVKVNSVTVNPNPAKAGQVLITVEFTEVHSVLDPTIDPEVYVLTHNGLKLVAKKTSFNNNKFTGRVEIPNQSGIDGPAAIWVSKATDSVGNEMPATNTNTFNIDVTLPTSHAFSKPYSGSSSLTISYQSSDPNQGTYASGVKSIDLYWRYSQDGEDFTDWVFYKQQTNNGTQGEFTYTALTEGTYEFYTLVTDVAGNTELPPVKADTKIIYELGNKDLPEVDWVKVNSQDTSLLPPVKNGYATITIKFKRNMDKVPLNYNILPSVTVTPYGAEPVKVEMSSYEEGTETWQGKLFINDHNSGEATINISGVTDVVGNIMRLDSVHTFFIDTLLPSSTVTHVPSYTKDSPIEVKFSSEDPDPSSELRNTHLWYRYRIFGQDQFSPWAKYNQEAVNGNEQGAFNFISPEPNATYEFYTRAEDKALNLEKPPAQADASTIYDTIKPKVSKVTINPSPAKAGKVTVTIEFEEKFSGLNYEEKPQVAIRPNNTNGAYDISLIQTFYENNTWIGEATISPTVANGQANLRISQATDKSGNRMDADNITYTFMVDTDYGDISSKATSPPSANSSSFEVDFISTDYSAGVDSVTIYYRLDQGTGFSNWEAFKTIGNTYEKKPTFTGKADFTPEHQGTYEFKSEAEDMAGNEEPGKTVADVSTIYDSIKPQSSVSRVPSPYVLGRAPFNIYFKASDAAPSSELASVKLFYRLSSENSWTDSWFSPQGVSHTGLKSGHFVFIPFAGIEGTYEFCTVATDKAGNIEALPLIGDLSVYVGLEEGSYEVGPSGRVIENGPLTLVIPPGAVSSWITVKVKPVASEAIVGFNPIGPVFDIQPSGMIFNKPVTLILEYKESQLNVDVAEKDLAIFYDDGFDWLPIPSTVDELNNTVSASLSHFSRYALGVINHRHAASSLLEGVILTHNPVKPKGAGWVATEFEFATTAKSGSATLNIFDALGEKVKTITKDLTGASAEDPVVIPWDGADDDGHLVNNGIYIFSLKVGSEVKTGVVGVVK